MSTPHLRQSERAQPLVAVVCAVPLIGEAMMSTLEFAEVRLFTDRGGDVVGLLQWLRPDAIVVDSDSAAEGASSYATQQGLPLLHISVRERALRLFHNGEWHHIANGEGPTPEVIRNVIAGALFARTGERLP